MTDRKELIERLRNAVTELRVALDYTSAHAVEDAIAALESPWAEDSIKQYVKPEHHVADAFWKYWKENGETHKHGYYESTWGAINAAINAQSNFESPWVSEEK